VTSAASAVPPAPNKPYLRFKDLNGAACFTAHPVVFLPGQYRQLAIQPGSRDPLGNQGIWANDMDASGSTDWVDDEHDGFYSRKVYTIQDALGARGQIDGVPYVIEDVLQVGKNVVVYQLTNLQTCGYVAYGFGIDDLDVRVAFHRYLQRIVDKKVECQTERMITLANRVLEAYPSDEAALFNKGVALLSDKKFAEAHASFQLAVNLNDSDLLALMHDAASLAAMGQQNSAIDQFARADAVSEEGVRSMLASFEFLRSYLGRAVAELMEVAPPDHAVRDLWLKYFPPV